MREKLKEKEWEKKEKNGGEVGSQLVAGRNDNLIDDGVGRCW